ncbi:hypothetical protein [Aquabacterium sp.]|uniref:hypothetical protein n=1 Tax=Aquabacterium sp. TaxID=1872578 RepID=UPI00378313F3
MPAAIPLVASFAAAGSAVAAAGGIAAAMGTVTGFLAVAGAALTTVGVLTGKKDLTKVGSLMGLGSSIISGFGNAAAGQAAGEAAGDAASEQAAQEGFRAFEHADAAAGGAGSDVVADAASAGTVAGGPGETATLQTAGMDQATAQAAKAGAAGEAIDPLQRANDFLDEASANSASAAVKPSLYDSAQEAFRRGELNSNSIYSQPVVPGGVTINGQVMRVAPDAVAEGARGLTADEINNLVSRGDNRVANLLDRGGFRRAEILDMNASPGAAAPIGPSGVTIGGRVMSTGGGSAAGGQPSLWDRAAELASRTGQFIERNPNLVLVGGKMLAGAFGPESEELDWKKSIYARKLANLNSPVRLTFGGGT